MYLACPQGRRVHQIADIARDEANPQRLLQRPMQCAMDVMHRCGSESRLSKEAGLGVLDMLRRETRQFNVAKRGHQMHPHMHFSMLQRALLYLRRHRAKPRREILADCLAVIA